MKFACRSLLYSHWKGLHRLSVESCWYSCIFKILPASFLLPLVHLLTIESVANQAFVSSY